MAVNKIELKRSAVPGRVPTTSSLDLGELAINTYDGRAFFKQSGSITTIVELATTSGSAASASFAISASYALSSSYTLSSSYSLSGSYAISSSFATTASQAVTASYVLASGVVGLNLSQIVSGSVTASVDPAYGFKVNSNATITGSLSVTGSLTTFGDSFYRVSAAAPFMRIGVANGLYPSLTAFNSSGIPKSQWINADGNMYFDYDGTGGTNLNFRRQQDSDSNTVARFMPSGNFLLQNAGTYTDNGYKVQIRPSGSLSGSLFVSGSTLLSGSLTVTGSITVSGSVINDLTASYAVSASQAISASQALTASHALNAANAFVQNGNSFGAQAVLGTNDLQNLALKTNGSTRLFISSSGFTGIGTTTQFNTTVPPVLLDVNGLIRARNGIQTIGDITTTIISSSRSDNTFPGALLFSGWGDYAFSNTLFVGYDSTTLAPIGLGQGNLFVRNKIAIGKTGSNAAFDVIGNALITGSVLISGSITVSGSITTTGTLTAQTLVVQTITSSTEYSSGSNIFGNDITNTQTFTGSVGITGSLSVNGTSSIVGTGTTNTLAKFSGTTAIGNSNITDSGTLISLGSNTTISSGGLGIGTTTLTGYSLNIAKNITGATTSYGVRSQGTVQSDVTTLVASYGSLLNTSAATFTLTDYVHYRSMQGTIGAGSVVTNQYGYYADSSMIGATNNYAFYSNIASGTNRWNIFMNGTAANYMAGSLGIGTTSLTGYGLILSKSITGGSTAYGFAQNGVVQSDVNTDAIGVYNQLNTQAATFTNGTYSHYVATQGTIGAGSVINNQYGFSASGTLTGAGLNIGFRGNIASGSNRWNIYMIGSAANYLAGVLNIGSTTLSGFQLDVTGTTRFVGTTASDTAPLGTELANVLGTGTNWTLAGTDLSVGGYTHTVGSVVALTTTLAAVIGTYYQIAYTITGRTAGTITIAYGGTSTTVSATGATGPLASSTAVLTITPTTDFDGTVVLSIKTISTSPPSSTFASSALVIATEIRASDISTNLFFGRNNGRRNTTGTNNTFVGSQVGINNTTGTSNTFVGSQVGINNTTGTSNTFVGSAAGNVNTSNENSFFGVNAGVFNTTGNQNTFLGTFSGQANTTGFSNTMIGRSAGQNNTTGNYNVMIGQSAGRYITGGSISNIIPNQSIFIGNDTRAAADNQTNQIVIGFQTTGLGSNTTIIGNSSTTLTGLYGNLVLGGNAITGSATGSGYTLNIAAPSTNGALQVSGSTSLSGSLNVSGSIITTGTITAQTLVVQTITSSIEYSSGSNIFGSRITDTQTFTGSVLITGSLSITGSSYSFNNTLNTYFITSSAPSGSNVIFSQPTGSYTSAFFKYTISSGSNARAGEVISVWNSTTSSYTDYTTTDIGNTSTVTSLVAISGNNVVYTVSSSNGGWTIKSLVVYI